MLTAAVVAGAATVSAGNTAAGNDYLDGWTLLALSVSLLVAAICLIAGLRGAAPGSLTVTATVLLQLTMLGYLARYAAAMASGQSSVGPAWELWAYLVTVVMLPALGLAWANEEKTRWGTLVLAVVAFIAGVMCARVAQIWYGVGMT